MHRNQIVAPFEIKFVEGAAPGLFEGYGAVFGNQDSHGDVIRPGAFADSLAERKSEGRRLPMYVMHGARLGADPVPVGVWDDAAEDSKGLYVKGRISGAANTEGGKLLYERVKDGALPGLSVGWSPRPNGVKLGKEAGDPKRTLRNINVHEISLVADPSNADAVVTAVKSAFADADPDKAAASLAAAMRLHDKSMGESYSYSSPKDKALLMDHLRDAHRALTGTRAPDGIDGWTKSISRSDFVAGIKATFGLTDAQAEAFADQSLGSETPGQPDVVPDTKAAAELGALLSGFDLPSF